MTRKLTTEEFIEKARQKHGDTYDYNNCIYKNALSKVEIICTIHGSFLQTPNSHLNGQGCKKCGFIRTGNAQRCAQDNFIEKVNIIHNFKYNYSHVNYININRKIEIICPVHGVFIQLAANHLKHGCPKCGIEHVSNVKRYTQDEFIERANLVHKNVYDYSNTVYFDIKRKIEIICKIHGSFFQSPNNHIHGQGCQKCLFKNETACREAIEKITGKLFPKKRPNFLEGLEFDGYNNEFFNGI